VTITSPPVLIASTHRRVARPSLPLDTTTVLRYHDILAISGVTPAKLGYVSGGYRCNFVVALLSVLTSISRTTHFHTYVGVCNAVSQPELYKENN